MKYMLDTHTLIWFLEGSETLSQNARNTIEKTESQKYVSIASIWEIAIKVSLGKLELNKPLEAFLFELSQTDIAILPIKLSHTIQLSKLEFFHKDPFDRLIIAQSIEEHFEVLTRDPNFRTYDIVTRW